MAALTNIQKPCSIKDIDHKIQKYAQRDILYPSVYGVWRYSGWALLGAFTGYELVCCPGKGAGGAGGGGICRDFS